MLRRLLIGLCLSGAALSGERSASVFSQSPPTLAIHDIQGNGATSPLVGQMVTTSGVVTASKSNGFFLQASDAEADGDPLTSEAIFVFTSQTPTVMTSQRVAVTGTGTEFRPAATPNGLPLTELVNPTINLLASLVSLPQPVTITAADLNPAGPLDQLEKYECMRVRAMNLRTVAPTGGSISYQSATATPNGILFAVFNGVARPFRELGLEPFAPLPPDAPCCVPRCDGNPERLRIDTRSSLRFGGQPGGPQVNASTGGVLTSVTGPLDYTAGNYSLLVDPVAIITPGPIFIDPQTIFNAVPVPAPTANEFTVASFNLERFFDTTDDPGVSDVALSNLAAVSARLGVMNIEVLFAGAQGELAGLDQVNLRLPRTLAGSGAVDVVLTVEGRQANAVSIAIN